MEETNNDSIIPAMTSAETYLASRKYLRSVHAKVEELASEFAVNKEQINRILQNAKSRLLSSWERSIGPLLPVLRELAAYAVRANLAEFYTFVQEFYVDNTTTDHPDAVNLFMNETLFATFHVIGTADALTDSEINFIGRVMMDSHGVGVYSGQKTGGYFLSSACPSHVAAFFLICVGTLRDTIISQMMSGSAEGSKWKRFAIQMRGIYNNADNLIIFRRETIKAFPEIKRFLPVTGFYQNLDAEGVLTNVGDPPTKN